MNMNSIMEWIKLHRRAFALGNDRPSLQTSKGQISSLWQYKKAVNHWALFLCCQARPLTVLSLRSVTTAVERKAVGSSWWHLLGKWDLGGARYVACCRAKLVMTGWSGCVCIFLWVWSVLENYSEREEKKCTMYVSNDLVKWYDLPKCTLL